MSADFGDVFSRYRDQLQDALRDAVPNDGPAPELFDLLRYHFGWLDENLKPSPSPSGKLLRPTICLLCCEAVGANSRRALPAAVALEMAHNFSLIHDDIEDHSRQRRWRRTLWDIWGEERAINAGDALLILAQLTLGKAPTAGVDPATTLAMLRLFNQDCLALTEGQHLDFAVEGHPDTAQNRYDAIITHKTAALLACSAQLGALSGDARVARSDNYRRFGFALGQAFQIQDDVLGIWGDPVKTGKPRAHDVYSRKPTLPVFLALEDLSGASRRRLVEVYQSVRPSDSDVADVITLLENVGAQARAEEAARQLIDQATAALEAGQPNERPASDLRFIAESLIGRTR